MDSKQLRDLLRKQLLIFDGAIGTEIYRRNYFINTSFEQLCLTAPDVIAEIHRNYAAAGAVVMTANSYNANALALEKFGIADQMEAINRAAVALARKAVGDNGWVSGALGPLESDAFSADLPQEKAVDILTEQGSVLLNAGADFLIFESVPGQKDLERILSVISRLRQKFEDPAIIVSFALDHTGKGSDGTAFAELYAMLAPAEVAAVGLNCGNGPDAMLKVLENVLPTISEPVVVEPNSGIPRKVDHRTVYLTSPEYFTTYARRYVELGVRGIGGCCGITPAHIRDMARSIAPSLRGESQSIRLQETSAAATEKPIPLAERSGFGAKLAAGQWLRSVEITPPAGFDLTSTIEKAKLCRNAGVDIINLPDGPRASARISPIITAARIQAEAKIETMLHMCARDRSLLGLQSALLGCAGIGIHNILFITGDPPKLGDYELSSGVFDVDAIGMVRMASLMNRGLDAVGKSIQGRTSTVIAVGADPNALDQEREYRRICEKIEAGAELIISQPVFAVAPLMKFLDRIERLQIPLMAGIWPLASYRNAEFMRNEVPGVVVPDEIMLQMAAASGKEEQRQTGIRIARQMIDEIRDRVCGIQVSAPFGNIATALTVHGLGE